MSIFMASSCSGSSENAAGQYIIVNEGRFFNGDSVYRFAGANMWYAPLIAATDRGRLASELDSLAGIGIRNLRIMTGAEGPEGLPAHVAPSLQPSPGVYNDMLLEGLDIMIAELEKRDMKAVLYLTNSWEWSGGFSAYLEWAGKGKAVIPAVDGYEAYVKYASQFVLCDSAKRMYMEHVERIVGRTNSVTGRPYRESPAIMAWQICNEPRPFSKEGKEAFADWIKGTAALIKRIDPNHMVSTGSEGHVGCELDMELWERIHSYPEIDYATIHIWPANWGWARSEDLGADLPYAMARTTEYIAEHSRRAKAMGKPLVIEEFGYPRDGRAFAIGSPTDARDRYYAHVLSYLTDTAMVDGVNFWGWGGSAVPLHETWQKGDPYTGDPAQEPQGLYSVFASDSSTVAIIERAAKSVTRD